MILVFSGGIEPSVRGYGKFRGIEWIVRVEMAYGGRRTRSLGITDEEGC
jgi:hypothetical protein